MSKLLLFHFQITNSKLENKKFHFTSGYSYKVEIYEVSLWVTSSMDKLLFFHFRVTNSNLKNKKKFTSSY